MSTGLVLLCGVLAAGTGIGTQAAWTSTGIGRTPRQIMALSAGAKVSRPLLARGPFRGLRAASAQSAHGPRS